MSRQLSLFSYMRTPQNENIKNVVKTTLNSIISNVVENERKAKKSSTDYAMTTEKLQLWPKDEKFQFCDTRGGKPTDNGKKVSWISIDTTTETFCCWVCAKYPNMNNNNNKVTSGCSLWHRNYLMRYMEDKHEVSYSNVLLSSFICFILLFM